jgi:hypothetical protein
MREACQHGVLSPSKPLTALKLMKTPRGDRTLPERLLPPPKPNGQREVKQLGRRKHSAPAECCDAAFPRWRRPVFNIDRN